MEKQNTDSSSAPVDQQGPKGPASPMTIIDAMAPVSPSSRISGLSRSSSTGSASTTSTECFQHESFETFQHKVHALALELGTKFTDVSRLGGGVNNRIIAVTLQGVPDEMGLSNKTQAILRIKRRDLRLDEPKSIEYYTTRFADRKPDEPANKDACQAVESGKGQDGNKLTARVDEPRKEILDEAAILNLAAESGLPVPKVLAFDTTRDNALGVPYSLHSRLPGTNLESVFYDMTTEEKMEIAAQMADIWASFGKVKFPVSGRLLYDDTTEAPTKLPLSVSGRHDVAKKAVVRGFLSDRSYPVDRNQPLVEPASSLFDLLAKNIDNKFEPRKAVPPGKYDVEVDLGQKLEQILEEMKSEAGWFDEEPAEPHSILHHLGLEPRNIIADKTAGPTGSWRITGLIDWDEVICVPPVLTMIPPLWLWDESDDENLPEEVQEYYDDHDFMPLEYYTEINEDHLTVEGAKVRQRFEEVLVEKLYKPQYGEKALSQWRDDAYGRGRWLRRIWRLAYEGIGSVTAIPRFEQLEREWKAFTGAESSDDEDEDESEAEDESEGTEGEDSQDLASEHEISEPAVLEEVQLEPVAATEDHKDVQDQMASNADKRTWRNKLSDLFQASRCVVS